MQDFLLDRSREGGTVSRGGLDARRRCVGFFRLHRDTEIDGGRTPEATCSEALLCKATSVRDDLDRVSIYARTCSESLQNCRLDRTSSLLVQGKNERRGNNRRRFRRWRRAWRGRWGGSWENAWRRGRSSRRSDSWGHGRRVGGSWRRSCSAGVAETLSNAVVYTATGIRKVAFGAAASKLVRAAAILRTTWQLALRAETEPTNTRDVARGAQRSSAAKSASAVERVKERRVPAGVAADLVVRAAA